MYVLNPNVSDRKVSNNKCGWTVNYVQFIEWKSMSFTHLNDPIFFCAWNDSHIFSLDLSIILKDICRVGNWLIQQRRLEWNFIVS